MSSLIKEGRDQDSLAKSLAVFQGSALQTSGNPSLGSSFSCLSMLQSFLFLC